MAKSVAKAIVDKIISTHRVPLKILSDQGTNFESEMIHQLCDMLHIKKIRTSAHHPQTNGQCEKQNGTLCDKLASMVNKEGNDWDEWIDKALSVVRGRPHATSGVSPAAMLFSREISGWPDVTIPDPQAESPYK